MALDNVILLAVLKLGPRVLSDDSLLLGKLATAGEDELFADATNLYFVTNVNHVLTELLESVAGHGNDRLELGRRNLDIVLIEVDEVQLVVGNGVLLAVLDGDEEGVEVGLVEGEGEGVVGGHGADELEKVEHIETNDGLLFTLKKFEVFIELEMDENGVAVVHSNSTNALLVKLEVTFGENVLQGLDEGFEGRGLNSFENKAVLCHLDLNCLKTLN